MLPVSGLDELSRCNYKYFKRKKWGRGLSKILYIVQVSHTAVPKQIEMHTMGGVLLGRAKTKYFPLPFHKTCVSYLASSSPRSTSRHVGLLREDST